MRKRKFDLICAEGVDHTTDWRNGAFRKRTNLAPESVSMLTKPCRHIIERLPWRFCYWSGVAILFVWAAWQRFRLPLDPIADPDIWGYLSPALRKLTGGEFGHTHGRNFIYPGFVYLVLRAFGDFRAITVIQHVLGLLVGGVLLLSWRRVRVFMATPQVGPISCSTFGLLASAIFLLASEPIHFEMQLRPEGVSAFLVSINLYFAIQFAACGFVEHRREATAVYGVAAIFTSILLASVKPSFTLAAIVALLPVGIVFLRRSWSWQKVALAGGAIASAALLLLPEHFLARNDEASQTFLPATLFVIHADLIRDQMEDDLKHNAKVPYPREWLERVRVALSTEIAKSVAAGLRGYSTLGFNPDYLKYDQSSIAAQLHKEFGKNVSGLCAFYRFYYWRIWRERPLLLFKKIARQMRIFYAPLCPVYGQTNSRRLADEYQRSVTSLGRELYREIWTAYRPAMGFVNRTEALAQGAPVVQQPAYIRKPFLVLAATYLPSLLIALLLSVAVLLQEKWREHFGWLAALVLFASLYNMAICLEVAVIHSLEPGRYVTVQLFPAILAQFIALWFIFEFAFEIRRVKAQRATPM